jgi:hypothetical protein
MHKSFIIIYVHCHASLAVELSFEVTTGAKIVAALVFLMDL